MVRTVEIELLTGELLEYRFAECDFYTEGCDRAIEYTLYGRNHKEKDGGQMDYNSEKVSYNRLEDASDDIIMFALNVSEEDIPPYIISAKLVVL